MKYKSAFDIIGPVMVGPSSSHTAGAARIGLFARKFFGKQPTEVIITFYGSFAKTYKGHGTDVAIIAGLLNFPTDDERLPAAIDIAKHEGMKITFIESDEDTDHPNTAKLQLSDGTNSVEVIGISIGGGVMEIIELNGFSISLTTSKPALFITHKDVRGAIASIATVIANKELNISKLEASRKKTGDVMVTIIELDDELTTEVVDAIKELPIIYQIAIVGE